MLAWFRKAQYLPTPVTYSAKMKKRNDPDLPSYPPLFFVRFTQKIRAFFLRMNRRFTHPNVVMWEMAHNMWLAAGISVAAELGIADLVKEGPRSIADLASITNTHTDSLYRVMRMLASHGIFKEKKGRYFESTSLAVPLQEDQIRYLMLVHLNRNQFRMFGDLMESVRTGSAILGKKSGEALFDFIESEDQRKEWFNKAMTSASKMIIPILLFTFPFKRFKNIMDIGGGEGQLLASILSRAPKSKGLVFDLPGVISRSSEIIEDYALTGRMVAMEGNFFESVPGGGDLYILKSVLHDWDDESSGKILSRLHGVMDHKSRLLVIEAVLDEGNQASFGKMTDILMMVAAGGRERTSTQWETLLAASGFKIRKIHPTISHNSLIEAVKI